MALEEEIGADMPADAEETSWDSLMFRVLLGSHSTRSTWAHETLRSRSIRGIIEERVRLRGDCACRTTV